MPFVIKTLKKFEETEAPSDGNYIELSSLNNTISEVKFDYQHPNFSPEYDCFNIALFLQVKKKI